MTQTPHQYLANSSERISMIIITYPTTYKNRPGETSQSGKSQELLAFLSICKTHYSSYRKDHKRAKSNFQQRNYMYIIPYTDNKKPPDDQTKKQAGKVKIVCAQHQRRTDIAPMLYSYNTKTPYKLQGISATRKTT